jgi:hypothetical protein
MTQQAEFAKFFSFVNQICSDVTNKCRGPVLNKPLPSGYFKLYRAEAKPQGVFAYVIHQTRLERYRIDVWEKDAVSAKVTHLADGTQQKLMFGQPALIFYVHDNDSQSYAKVVEALGRICLLPHLFR